MLDPELQTVAKMRLDQFSIAEIATKVGRSRRTIDRRLERIREIWKASGSLEPGLDENRVQK